MASPAHIRVVSEDLVGNKTKVFYVDNAGRETEISDVLAGLQFTGGVKMGEINSVTFVKVKFDTRARS